MPADPFEQLGGMAIAGAVVAGLAVPLGLVLAFVNRSFGGSFLPPWRAYASRFQGAEILFLFGVYYTTMMVGPNVLDALGFYVAIYGPDEPATDQFRVVRQLWVSLFFAPVLLVAFQALPQFLRTQSLKLESRLWPGRVAFAVAAWWISTPVVIAIYFLTLLLVQLTGGPKQEHPLTETGPGATLFDQALFGVVVCVFTPLMEEILFRGLLVRWAAGRWYRPWILVAFAGVALLMPSSSVEMALLGLAVAFGLGLYAIQRIGRSSPTFPVRTTSAIYGSAALFGAVHAAIWPTPIPLFFLGLALGYVAIRSGSILGPVVMHGLFNAVSFAFLLRNG